MQIFSVKVDKNRKRQIFSFMSKEIENMVFQNSNGISNKFGFNPFTNEYDGKIIDSGATPLFKPSP